MDRGFTQQRKGKQLFINVWASGRWLQVTNKSGWTKCYTTIRPGTSPLFLSEQQQPKVCIQEQSPQTLNVFYVAALCLEHNSQYPSSDWPMQLSVKCIRKKLLLVVQMYVLLLSIFFVFENGAIMLKCNKVCFLLFLYFISAPAVPALYLKSSSSPSWH